MRALACQRRHRFDDGTDDERVQSGHGENQCDCDPLAVFRLPPLSYSAASQSCSVRSECGS